MLRRPASVQTTLRSAVGGTLVGIAIVFVFVLFQATQFYELTDPRAMDQAQLARNISRGEGFTTKLVRPLSLARFPRLNRHPDVASAPLHPLFMSLLFRALGPSARVASWASGIPFLVTIPLVLWLGTRAFSRKVGVLAAMATAANLGLLGVATGGTAVPLAGLLFTLLAVVVIKLHETERRCAPLTAAAGALTALLYLTHYLYLLVFLPIAVLVVARFPARQRVVALVVFVLAFGLVCSPWWVRNLLLVRDPLYTVTASEMVMGTRTHAGNTLYRSMDPAPDWLVPFAFHNPREIYEKVHDAAMLLHPVALTVAGVVMTPFFLVAIIIPLGHVGLDRLRYAVCACLVLLAGGALLLMPDRTVLLPLAPVMTVVGAAFFYQLLDLRLRPLAEGHRARWTSIAVTVLLVLHGLPVLLQLAPGRTTGAGQPAQIMRACQELNNLTSQLAGGARPAT